LKQTSETVCTDGRVPDEIRKRVPDCRAVNCESSTAVSVGITGMSGCCATLLSSCITFVVAAYFRILRLGPPFENFRKKVFTVTEKLTTFTDRVSLEGKAINNASLSVPPCFYFITLKRLTFELQFLCVRVGHNRSWPGIESHDHDSRSKVNAQRVLDVATQ